MAFADKIKNDLARNRKSAMVAVGLGVIMLAFVAKAYFDMAPRNAAASVTPTASPVTPNAAARAADSEEKLKQSRLLWKTLREKRGLSPEVAFSFESTFFNLSPKARVAPVPDHTDVVETPRNSSFSEKEAALARRRAAVLTASRNLVVRSTVVTSSLPVAVINDQTVAASDRILGVGDRISGFTITAIRAREVEFEKDGVTVAVEMARSK